METQHLILITKGWIYMRRLACLIGNNEYVHWNSLSCAVNDAIKMKCVLENHGFETKLHKNLNMDNLKEAIKEFEYNLLHYDAGLLFYAGHGVEIEGCQYLVPIDSPKSPDFDKDLYDTTRLIQLFSSCTANEENFAGIIIFDCCRSRMHKFRTDRGCSDRFQSTAKGVFIAFATEPDKTAKEVDGHGVFTLSLCDAIEQYGSEKIEDVLKYARKKVVNRYSDQIPWDNSSLLGDFYFNDIMALLNKNEIQEKNWLSPDFLHVVLDDDLSYTQIKEGVYHQADDINATVSQREELLLKVLDQLDSLYINKNQNKGA